MFDNFPQAHLLNIFNHKYDVTKYSSVSVKQTGLLKFM
jgi:hypothetical protein